MVFENAVSTFAKNIGILLVFSISFLLALLMPLFAATPTYNAIGATFLRFLSIPEMSLMDVAVIAFAFLLSNYFVAFGVVAVNLIVKRERVQVNLTQEILQSIPRSTLVLFLIFVFLFILNFAVQYVLAELQAPYWLAGLVFLLIYLPTFYVGPAIVIDQMKPVHAVYASVQHIRNCPDRVAKWVVAGLAMLIVATAGTYLLLPAYFQWATLIINSFIIIPFLIVYQAHNYIEKYTILKKPARGRKR
ncbi:MAG: hypothetical protein N3H30_02875 [Candidatus Micrarchaeota archaeon]|nr:hypothetical protein [Candidatus Micrarchaeota archaeon]